MSTQYTTKLFGFLSFTYLSKRREVEKEETMKKKK